MAAAIPYTYIQCPCTRDTRHDRDERQAQDDSTNPEEEGAEEAEEDDDFDPKSPRANYSLYPIEHLLYCEICAQIRCQRCLMDEIVAWFCPNCLFEVPRSTVKSDGNRCTRSCFQCPICIAPLSLTAVEATPANALLGAEQNSQYILSCACCSWSSREIGIKFDKPNSIYSQLSRIRNGGQVVNLPKERSLEKDVSRRPERSSTLSKVFEDTTPGSKEDEEAEEEDRDPTPEARFANLRTFYQDQMAAHDAGDRSGFSSIYPSTHYTYTSPKSLARIVRFYTNEFSSPTPRKKTPRIREVLTASEGLFPTPTAASEAAAIHRLRTQGWRETPSTEQRAAQPYPTIAVSSTADLRPTPYLLRTKRMRRCRTCRHIVALPEAKVQTSRFRMKMLAASYIPTLKIRPLPSPSSATPTSSAPTLTPLLQPGRTHQFVLTVLNPLYERVRVTLATASRTPGRIAHSVTLLCPQFEVGASREAYADFWDEALGDGKAQSGKGEGEAGKVYERTRNSVGVVVEVLPGELEEEEFQDARSEQGADEEAEEEAEKDILEISVRVRVEWEGEGGDEKDEKEEGPAGKVKKELEFWVVLGVGRVASG